MSQSPSTAASWLTWPYAALDRYFFPTTTAVRLAVMRIVLVTLQLVWFIEPLSSHLKLLEGPGFVGWPQPMIRATLRILPATTLRTPEFLGLVWYATVLLGILAAIGLFARLSTFLFGVGCLFLISHLYSYGEYHHPEAIYLMTITFIGLGPCGKCLSVDAWLRRKSSRAFTSGGGPGGVPWGPTATTRWAMWPLLLGQWLLMIAYFEAFGAKVLVGGPQWFNGYTLQQHMLGDAVKSGLPLGMFLAQYHWLSVFMSIGAVGLEGAFFLVMFPQFRLIRLITPWLFFGGVMLHTMIYLTQAAPFFEFIVLYVMWFPAERYVQRWLERHEPVKSTAAEAVAA